MQEKINNPFVDIIHFKPSEFVCPCGCYKVDMDHKFLNRLDTAREIAKIPFIITSGFRCAVYNATLDGSVRHSSHTRGFAADILHRTSRERHIILTSLIRVGFNRFGLYEYQHIHVDKDPEKPSNVLWIR
jgi:hypothetical protein